MLSGFLCHTSEKSTLTLTGVVAVVWGRGADSCTGTPVFCPRACIICIISASLLSWASCAARSASSWAVRCAVCSSWILSRSWSHACNIALKCFNNANVIQVLEYQFTTSKTRITSSLPTHCSVGVGHERMCWLELVLCARIWLRERTLLESMAAFAIHARPCFLPLPSLMMALTSMGSVRMSYSGLCRSRTADVYSWTLVYTFGSVYASRAADRSKVTEPNTLVLWDIVHAVKYETSSSGCTASCEKGGKWWAIRHMLSIKLDRRNHLHMPLWIRGGSGCLDGEWDLALSIRSARRDSCLSI